MKIIAKVVVRPKEKLVKKLIPIAKPSKNYAQHRQKDS